MKTRPLLLAVSLIAGLTSNSNVSARDPDPLLDNHDFVSSCRLADRLQSAELTDDQAAQALICVGFVAGVFGAVSAPGRYELHGTRACVSGPARTNDIIHKVVANANSNPEALDRPGTEPRNLVIGAVAELFPCKT